MPTGGYFGRALVVDVTDGTSRDRRARRPDCCASYIGGAGLGVLAAAPTWRPPGVDPLGSGGAAGVRVLPAGRDAADDQRQVRRGGEVAADRHAHRRAGVQPLRHRGQAHRARRDRRRRAGRPARACCSSTAADVAARAGRRPESGCPPRGHRGRGCASGSAARWQGGGDRPGGGARRALRHDLPRRPARRARRARCGARRQERQGRRGAAADQGGAGRPGRRAGRRARTCGPRSFGAATAKYRELGTLANLLAFNALATLPTRNFQAATFDGAPALAAEELAELRGTTQEQLRLLHDRLRAHLPARQAAAARTMRVEYENVFALGPMCGVSDPDDVLEASARCDELGHRHHLGRRHDRLGDGVRRARADRRAVAAVRRRQRAAARARRDRRAAPGSVPLLALGSRRAAAARSAAARPTSRRTSRAWRCPATSRGRCTRWRSASRSTPAAPTTTGPVPTRPTCPATSTGSTAGRRTWPRRSRPRTGPR